MPAAFESMGLQLEADFDRQVMEINTDLCDLGAQDTAETGGLNAMGLSVFVQFATSYILKTEAKSLPDTLRQILEHVHRVSGGGRRGDEMSLRSC